MTRDNICTSEELKNLADNSELTISELSKFIQNKTDQEYFIVQKKLVKDISDQLFKNTQYIFDINAFMNETWEKLVKTNRQTTDKWKETLKACDS